MNPLIPLAALYGFQVAPPAGQVPNQPEVVMILGKVTAIKIASLKYTPLDWVVSVEVEKVESGRFDAPIFTFLIHKPSAAGLVIGSRYQITAIKQPDYYSAKESEIKAAK